MTTSTESRMQYLGTPELRYAQSQTAYFVRGIDAGTNFAQKNGDIIAGTVIQADPELDKDYSSLIFTGDFEAARAVLAGIYEGVEQVVRRNHE